MNDRPHDVRYWTETPHPFITGKVHTQCARCFLREHNPIHNVPAPEMVDAHRIPPSQVDPPDWLTGLPASERVAVDPAGPVAWDKAVPGTDQTVKHLMSETWPEVHSHGPKYEVAPRVFRERPPGG